MAFDIKDEAPAESGDRALLTGIANLSVVALNPTKAEQEAMGRKPKEEPVYFQMNKTGTHEQVQLDIYLSGSVTPDGESQPVEVLVKHTIWVENSTERNVYIDQFGKFGKDAAKLDASARLSYSGEVDLVQFLKALCNLGQKDAAGLDNARKMVEKGDLSEIKAIFNDAHKRGRKVRVLLGVREQKYQDLFGKQFEYEGQGGTAYLHKQFVRQADYERANPPKNPMAYCGPINALSEVFSPSAYVARRYSVEAFEAFEASLPKGTFGAGPGGPGAGAFSAVAPKAGQPFSTGNEPFPQQRFNAAPQPTNLRPQPVPAGYIDDSDLPF